MIVLSESAASSVTAGIDWTERFLNGLTTLLHTKGIDFLEALIIFSVGYFLCQGIRKLVHRILVRSRVEVTAINFITEMAYFFSLVIVLIVALGTAGVNPSALAAGFGAIGLAIGLGLKDNIGNVASGIFLLIFQPLRVGDYIEVGAYEGTVRAVRIMYTEIATLGNQMIVIPNSKLTTSTIKNYSRFDTRNIEFTFDVGYDTDLPACISLIQKVINGSDYVLNKFHFPIYVSEMASSSIRIYTRISVKRDIYYEAQNALYIEIKKALDQANIDIPFPQLVIHQSAR